MYYSKVFNFQFENVEVGSRKRKLHPNTVPTLNTTEFTYKMLSLEELRKMRQRENRSSRKKEKEATIQPDSSEHKDNPVASTSQINSANCGANQDVGKIRNYIVDFLLKIINTCFFTG